MHHLVTIQITPESMPSIPPWMGEVASFAKVVLATSFVTPHTSTAFTFYTRRIILFSALQRHRAWDICSPNWTFRASSNDFLVKAPDGNVQSLRFRIHCYSVILPILMKERFSWRFVSSLPSSNEFASTFTCSKNVFWVGSNYRRLPLCSAHLLT